MADRRSIRHLFFEIKNTNNHLYIALAQLRARIVNLNQDLVVPHTIIADLRFLVTRNIQGATELLAEVLLTHTTSLPFDEKLMHLEQAAPKHADAAYFCGRVYLGMCKEAPQYKDDHKAIKYFQLASSLEHTNASFALISAMLEGFIEVNEQQFFQICTQMVDEGDLYAALYCASVLCNIYPKQVKDWVKLRITPNHDLAFKFIMTVVNEEDLDERVESQLLLLVATTIDKKIWPKKYDEKLRNLFTIVSKHENQPVSFR